MKLARIHFKPTSLLAAAISLSLSQSAIAQVNLDIPAGELDTVLSKFAVDSGVEFYVDASLTQGLYSPGLQGEFDIEQALALLLKDTGLDAAPQNDGSFLIDLETDEFTLDPIQVESQSEVSRDEQGEWDVYDQNNSTSYVNKEEVERFKGSSATDLFTSVANAYSADGRASGSIDPNIRGIQGPGRVPVTIDGTEQAVTAYKGYRGAGNRNYLDPNLVGSMKVQKGPAIDPDMSTSVGGGIAISTLAADDILLDGNKFGMELVLESSSNSISPREPQLFSGQDFKQVPFYIDYVNRNGIDMNQLRTMFQYQDPALLFHPRDRTDNPLNGEDGAARLAIAGKHERLEWLTAYAYRKRGNYFSGKNGSDFYRQEECPTASRQTQLNPYWVASCHLPGQEVHNTSSEMTSYLLKGALKFNTVSELSLGARYTESIHGEMFASRAENRTKDGMPQWPLSKVQLQAYNADFSFNPSNPSIDMEVGLWATLSDIADNTGSNSPNYPDANDILYNGARNEKTERRYGINAKNTQKISDKLDLTLSADYQRHVLTPKGDLVQMIEERKGSIRSGEREEFKGSITAKWRPKSHIQVDAGLRYGRFKAEDDVIKYAIDSGQQDKFAQYWAADGYTLSYDTEHVYTESEMQARVDAAVQQATDTWNDTQLTRTIKQEELNDTNTKINALDIEWAELPAKINAAMLAGNLAELGALHARGLHIQNVERPALQAKKTNLENLLAEAVTPLAEIKQNAENLARSQTSYTESHQYVVTQDTSIAEYKSKMENLKSGTLQKVDLGEFESRTGHKSSGAAWMPSLAVGWQLDMRNKVYAKYTQAVRFPSLFESTTGFSASPIPDSAQNNERSKLFEVGYVHYLDKGNIKLSHFTQKTDNMMDRDRGDGSTTGVTFVSIDKHTVSGFELQADYDTGNYYGEFSAAYNYENEVCDSYQSIQLHLTDPSKPIQTCVRGGYGGGSYLSYTSPPKHSATLHLGARTFNQSLETGFRTHYSSKSDSEDKIQRDSSLTFDAYIGYEFNDHFDIELVGTNLFNLYYMEPSSGAGLPAPGRTISMKFKGKF